MRVKTIKLFMVEYTTKPEDEPEIKRFWTLDEAKQFLSDGLTSYDGKGEGVCNGQIVEYEIWPDGKMPFPAYYESSRIATYYETEKGWEKIND